MQGRCRNKRKAISPIIATLTLVAVTLVAAVAVGGFIFGVFSSQTSTAQVSVTYAQIAVPQQAGTFVIQVGQEPQSYVGTIRLVNSGTSSIGISGLSLTYGGSTYFASASSGTISAGGTQTIYITGLSSLPTSGQQFTGAVVLSNGAQVPFVGTFV
ncbi:MAG: archaellin/type IV pilin N-terminal domain-containing protein [Nitrososphaerales archaeon]